jgi:glutamine amidotransferase-like uncharacterized protein
MEEIIPLDINQHKTIMNKPQQTRKLSLAIYKGEGAGDAGITNVIQNISKNLDVCFTEISAEYIKSNNLSEFDTIIFSGGSGSKQGLSLGKEGRENIQNYIKHGGNYLGICAGAYLATCNFDWSLGIINTETISKTR